MTTAQTPEEDGKRVASSWLYMVVGTWLLAGIWATIWYRHGHLPKTSASPAIFLAPRRIASSTAFDATKLQQLDHLILVPGHAVLDPHAESLEFADEQESVWHLMEYQRNQDLPQVLVSHIQRGVQEAAEDPNALLVFSGGQTRPEAGPHDEGSSYLRVAEHYDWWGHGSKIEDSELSVAQRAVTEDFAADSFQNVLFSICRFREVVGAYPKKISVVGFSFKQDRFVRLHRAAIRFPVQSFNYIGIHPSHPSKPMLFDLAQAEEGERTNSVVLFQADPYGCSSSQLLAKRTARNPFRRTNPYPLSCPELRGLLEWCKEGLYPFPLPWNSSTVNA